MGSERGMAGADGSVTCAAIIGPLEVSSIGQNREVEMRKLIAMEWMSLDGVVQAPAYPDEDTSGGFKYGGWHLQYFEDVSMKWVVENVTQAGGFVFGRRTYDKFAAYWPKASSDGEQALAVPLNTRPKYVASRTLKEPFEWNNSRLLKGDIAAEMSALKRADGGTLLAIGSTELLQALIANNLVDEFRVMIDPIFLGAGKRIFRDDGPHIPLQLAGSEVTSTGALLATYVRIAV
jgi:dihydrofolate reductase